MIMCVCFSSVCILVLVCMLIHMFGAHVFCGWQLSSSMSAYKSVGAFTTVVEALKDNAFLFLVHMWTHMSLS